MYLVDTNILSIGSPSKKVVPLELVAWMEAHSSLLFLSAVSVAEIEAGIAKSRRGGALRNAALLDAWIETLVHLYAARVLAVDIDVARLAGRLSDKARGLGHAPGLADVLIAATAIRHGLVLLTQNVKHFLPLGVPVQNPFLATPT